MATKVKINYLFVHFDIESIWHFVILKKKKKMKRYLMLKCDILLKFTINIKCSLALSINNRDRIYTKLQKNKFVNFITRNFVRMKEQNGNYKQKWKRETRKPKHKTEKLLAGKFGILQGNFGNWRETWHFKDSISYRFVENNHLPPTRK